MKFITRTDLENLKLFKRMCLLADSPYEVEDETWKDIYEKCEMQMGENGFFLDPVASCLKMYVDFYRMSIYKPLDFVDYVKDSLLSLKMSYASETFRILD